MQVDKEIAITNTFIAFNWSIEIQVDLLYQSYPIHKSYDWEYEKEWKKDILFPYRNR